MHLLHSLCRLPAPAGNEAALTQSVLDYVRQQQGTWRHQPQIIADERFRTVFYWYLGSRARPFLPISTASA